MVAYRNMGSLILNSLATILFLSLFPRCDGAGEEFPGMTAMDNGTIPDAQFVFDPHPVIVLSMKSQKRVDINFNLDCLDDIVGYMLQTVNTVPDVGTLVGNQVWYIECHDNVQTLNGSINITVQGDVVGKSFIYVFFQSQSEAPRGELKNLIELPEIRTTPVGIIIPPEAGGAELPANFSQPYPVLVVFPVSGLDKYFRVLITVFVIMSMLMMGCKTSMKVVKNDLRRPFSPLVGLCCQYIAMPLIAFTIATVTPYRYPIMRLGIFAVGCCPGGGNSNFYAYLLGGDVSLSITMTTVSSFASFALFPLWLLTLGQQFIPEDSNIEIPFITVFISILMVTIPLIAGIFFRWKFPKAAKIYCKVTMPLMIVLLVVIMVFFIIANDYVWEILSATEIIAGAFLPNSGLIIGGLVAWITRHNWVRIKTIALETGLQNMAIAMTTLLYSIPPPDSNLAIVAAVAAGLMTGAALTPITLIYIIWKKCRDKFYKEVPSDEKNYDQPLKKGKPDKPSKNGESAGEELKEINGNMNA